VWVLGEMKGDQPAPAAVDELIKALKYGDESIRPGAAHSLGKLNDPKAVKTLTGALKDMDPTVRTEAAIALNRMEKPSRRVHDWSLPACRGVMRIIRKDVWWPAGPREIGQTISALTGIPAKLQVHGMSQKKGSLRLCIECKGERGSIELFSKSERDPFRVKYGCKGTSLESHKLLKSIDKAQLEKMLTIRRGLAK
jgi:hypothetical protein